MKIMFDRYYCINSNTMQNKARYLGTVFFLFFFASSLDHGLQRGFYIEMHGACRNQQDNGDDLREVGSIHVAV